MHPLITDSEVHVIKKGESDEEVDIMADDMSPVLSIETTDKSDIVTTLLTDNSTSDTQAKNSSSLVKSESSSLIGSLPAEDALGEGFVMSASRSDCREQNSSILLDDNQKCSQSTRSILESTEASWDIDSCFKDVSVAGDGVKVQIEDGGGDVGAPTTADMQLTNVTSSVTFQNSARMSLSSEDSTQTPKISAEISKICTEASKNCEETSEHVVNAFKDCTETSENMSEMSQNCIEMSKNCTEGPKTSAEMPKINTDKSKNSTDTSKISAEVPENSTETCKDMTESCTDTTGSAMDYYTPATLRFDYGVLNCNGELVAIAAPDQESDIDRDSVSDLEKQVHFDFFSGRANKTPERYLRIRNYILDRW